MATKNDRRTSERDLPDLEAEREVDLRRHWNTIAIHWWLPAAGLAIGIVIGYLISLGGSQVYRAKAVVYLGQPLSASGVQVQSQATNPSTVRQIVLAPATIDSVARRVGMRPGQLSGHVSIQAVSGAITRLGQNPLVAITVTGHLRGRVAAAANALATAVVTSDALDGYPRIKISGLKRKLKSEADLLASIDNSTRQLQAAIQSSNGTSTLERLILANVLNGQVQQRQQIVVQQASDQQLLALAQKVEAPQVNARAVATKTTARSRRNTVLVAALIGLILGVIAALVWEPLVRTVRRSA
jgi:hypothetical protein